MVPVPSSFPKIPVSFTKFLPFSTVTYNCTSLCEYSDTPAGKSSRSRVRKALLRFSKARIDVICLQETKLKANEQHALAGLLTDYVIFFNNRSKNVNGVSFKGGTLVAVRIPVLGFYSVENFLVVPGHIQCLLFTPLDPDRAVVTIVNIRLPTGSGKTEKQVRAIDKLWKLLPPAHIRYLLGDLNFTTEAGDSTGGVPDEPPNWGNFLREFSLNEVVQSSHTWFSANATNPCSSRLDRVYLSLPETEWLLGTPKAWVSEDVLGDIKSQHAFLESTGQREMEVGVNTHLPVFLRFFEVPKLPKRPPLHSNVFQDPSFLGNFNKVYSVPSDAALKFHPEKCLRLFKKALKESYKATTSPKHKPERILKFSVCLTAFRELNKPLPSFKVLKGLCVKHEFLRELIHWTGEGWSFTGLKAALSNALLEGVPDPTGSDPVGPKALGGSPNRSAEILKNLKFILPSTKKRVSCLSSNLETAPTSDPTQLGTIINEFWGAVWSPPPAGSAPLRGALIDDYLEDYQPPSAAALPDLELDHVSRSILSSGNSAPGPDGIPFIAYRVTVEHAARVLFAYALHLRNSPSDLASFNASTLLLLPKGSSHLVKDTRPLCISNTDNRIVARALVLLVTPTADSVTDLAQQGFICGRLMSKHLLDLNQRFYDAWQTGEEYFVLFTDNSKAFDSIHHDFILKVLRKQGFPEWYVLTVKSLLSEVSVSPTISPASRVGIGRGVKQGCPMSPTLFVLIYDPLVRSLKEFKSLEPRAAADDLAVGSSCLEDLFSLAIPCIDAFCKVSGMGINRDKSEILSSCPLDDPPLHSSLLPLGLCKPSERELLVSPLSVDPGADPVGFDEGLALSEGSDSPDDSEDFPLSISSVGSSNEHTPLSMGPSNELSREPVNCLTPPGSPVAPELSPTPPSIHPMSLRERSNATSRPATMPKVSSVRTRPRQTVAQRPKGSPKKHRKKKAPRLTQPKASKKELAVLKVVDKRWNPNQHPSNRVNPLTGSPFGFWEFRVQWQGFGPEDDTWEPLENLTRCLPTVSDFDETWHRPKTLRETLQVAYHSCPTDWKGIKLVNQAKYLGIFFSNSKDTYKTMELNFRPALSKAKQRLSAYRIILKNVPLSTRILIVNVFVTSLFSYLIGFLLIPLPLYWEYRGLVASAVVPFHGKAFKYEHLAMPPLLMGVKLCIADLWVQNVYRLLSRSSFRKMGSRLASALPWQLGTKDETQGVYYYSPAFNDSVDLALMEFLGPNFLGWDGLSDLSNLKDADIKRTLVRHGLHQVKDQGEVERARYKDLVVKFAQHGTTPVRSLEHFATIPPGVPNSLLEHHLLLYTNALATDKRVRHFAPEASVHPAKSLWYPYPCYFCGLGTDSIKHIYTECEEVRNLLVSLSRPCTSQPPLIDSTFVKSLNPSLPLFIFDFPLPRKGEQNGAAFLLSFNREVWMLRRELRAGVCALFCINAFRKKLRSFAYLWASGRHKKSSNSRYGSASSRTPIQKERCFKDGTRLVDSAGLEGRCHPCFHGWFQYW